MKNAATILIGVYLLLAAPLAAFALGNSVATFVVVGGICCAVLLRWQDLVEVTVGPLKAKLERQVAEATATLTQLRSMGAVLGETILTVLAAEGRMGGMPFRDKFSRKVLVIEELKKLGLSPEQIHEATRTWVRYITFDHASRIFRLQPEVIRAAMPELREMLGKGVKPAGPDEWRAVLARMNLVTPETEEAINDYRHFIATEELRRPQAWGLED